MLLGDSEGIGRGPWTFQVLCVGLSPELVMRHWVVIVRRPGPRHYTAPLSVSWLLCAATLLHKCGVVVCVCVWCYRLAGRPEREECASADYQPASKPATPFYQPRAHALTPRIDC